MLLQVICDVIQDGLKTYFQTSFSFSRVLVTIFYLDFDLCWCQSIICLLLVDHLQFLMLICSSTGSCDVFFQRSSLQSSFGYQMHMFCLQNFAQMVSKMWTSIFLSTLKEKQLSSVHFFIIHYKLKLENKGC